MHADDQAAVAAVGSPLLRLAVGAGEITRYIPVAGTHAWRDAWCMDDDSAFARMTIAAGFAPVRAKDGRPFRWSTSLAGLLPWKKEEIAWLAGADALYYFCQPLPYEDLNFIAHSHGGNVVLLLAASGLKIRSLTTIGTPPRDDVPAKAALANIGCWTHIFDQRFDKMGWLGQLGEGGFQKRRSFRLPGMTDCPIGGIDHSSILRDAAKVALWTSHGWLDNMRLGNPEATRCS